MDYGKLTEALVLLKKTCVDNEDCYKCPLGDSNGECKINEESPSNWDIPEKQIIRLLV